MMEVKKRNTPAAGFKIRKEGFMVRTIAKNLIWVIALCGFILISGYAWASLGETTGQVGKSSIDTGLDLVKLPVDLVKTIGYSIKLVGEVIVFPFTLLF